MVLHVQQWWASNHSSQDLTSHLFISLHCQSTRHQIQVRYMQCKVSLQTRISIRKVATGPRATPPPSCSPMEIPIAYEKPSPSNLFPGGNSHCLWDTLSLLFPGGNSHCNHPKAWPLSPYLGGHCITLPDDTHINMSVPATSWCGHTRQCTNMDTRTCDAPRMCWLHHYP